MSHLILVTVISMASVSPFVSQSDSLVQESVSVMSIRSAQSYVLMSNLSDSTVTESLSRPFLSQSDSLIQAPFRKSIDSQSERLNSRSESLSTISKSPSVSESVCESVRILGSGIRLCQSIILAGSSIDFSEPI